MYYLKQDENKPFNGRLPVLLETNDERLYIYALRSMTDITEEEYTALKSQQDAEATIVALKKNLADTDYIACKIAEGAATREEYAEIIAQRQAWRDEINQLEN